MGNHAVGAGGQAPEGNEVLFPQNRERRADAWQTVVRIHCDPTVTRHVLDRRLHSSRAKTVDEGRPKVAHPVGIVGEGPIADDIVHPGKSQVERGGARDIDAQRCHVVGQQATGKPCGPLPSPGNRGGRKTGPPVGFPETRHTPAFLVDHDRRRVASDNVAEGCHKFADLGWIGNVAAEENDTEGIEGAQKGFF